MADTPQLSSLLYDIPSPPTEVATPMQYVSNDIQAKAKENSYSANYLNFTQTEQANSLDNLKDNRIKLKEYDVNLDEAYATLSDGSLVSRYETFQAGSNNEERLAQNQSTAEKWTNGTLKLLGKTGVAVLGGTLGVVDSLVEGVSKGSLSEAYNTGFNNWLDDLNVKMDYKLPNYYTEQEKNASLLGQTTQANFWADKVFGGLSFTAGALISEGIWTAATGGVGLLASEGQLARLAKWTAKGVGGESKLASALNTAKKWAKGSADNLLETTAQNSKSLAKEVGAGENLLTAIAEGTKDASINAYKIKKLGDIALVMTRSAGYEAGMEARQYMNSTEHAWLENYQKVNGHEPSADEYSAFKDELTTTGNAVFGANMIIVGTSNIAQFGNALLGKTTNPLAGNNFLKRSLLGVGFDKEVSELGKVTYKALEATKAQRIAGKAWGILGAAIPEAQEEMGQRVVSQTAENYMLKAFDSKNTKTTYGIADAFTESLNNTYGTKEGWSEGLIGAIVGILGAGAHSRFKFGEVTEEREDIKKNVDYANSFTAENHMNNVIANNKIIAAQESKEQAQQRGDLVGEILADSASAIHYIDRNLAIGNTHEGVADFTRQVNAVSNADLAIDLGLGTGEEAEKQAENFKEQKITEFKNLSDKHQKNLNYAQALLGETQIAGLDKTSTREVVRAMAYSMTMGEVAMKTNQDLVSHVKTTVAESLSDDSILSALDVQQVLDLAPKEKTLKLAQLNLHLESLDRQEKKILNQQFEASKVSESSLTTPEDSKARQNALIDINRQLVELQEEKEVVTRQKQLAKDAISIRNYTDTDITVDMFDAQNENLDKLRDVLKDIKLSDPQKFFEIQKALQAQSKAVQHIHNYRRTTQAIVNPNTRVKVLNGWITNLLHKNTKLNEGTATYFTDVLENWQKETVVVFQESENLKQRRAFQNGEEVSESYKQELGKDIRAGKQLNSVDKEIYDAYQKEIEDNAKETIEPRTQEDRIREEIANLENLMSTLSPTINRLEDLDKLTQAQKEELKRQVKEQLDKISDDVFFLTHLTQTASNLESILSTGLNTGAAIEGTTNVSSDKDGLFNSISALIDGKVRHSGASNLVIMAFPKSIIPSGTPKNSYTSFVEDYIAENSPSDFGQRIPTSANIATFTNGQLNVLGEATQPNLREQYQNKVNELKKQLPKVQLTTLQQLKNKVTEIIGSNDYLTQYFGSDLAEQNKTKPSGDDVREYEDLLSKIDRNVEPNTDRIVSRPTGFYKNIGLTDEETDDLKRLQTKLNDWVTLEGTVTNDSQSVAEMLDLIDALQTKVTADSTKTELTDPDYTSVVDSVDEVTNSMGSSVRGLQTPTSALVTRSKNNIRFSHIIVETLASFFPNSNLVVNENKTFEIFLSNGQTLAGKINEKGGQDIPLKEWNAVAPQSNVLIKNFGTNSSAISQFLGVDSQGNEQYQNVPSDFDYQQTDGTNLTIDQLAVNQVKNGDILDLFVSSTDSYNASLSKKELPDFIHIYVMKNGKFLGSLPAPFTKDGKVKEGLEGIGIPLSDLRKFAAEYSKGKEGLIKLPQKMTAQITFIGAPQITLEKNGDEVVTKNNPFTKEMLQNVVGQGFIENGQVKSTVKIDVNQFINKISSGNRDAKIPFVVFNYNNKAVAFPINLNSFTVDQSEAVLEVFNSTEATTAVKAKTLVDALIANGLEASSYGIDFTDKEGWIDSQETENALNDLSQIKQFTDLERFATKNYNKESLINDATIAIDISNEPFLSSKIMLSMSNKIDSDVLGYREFLAENEEKEKQLRTDLNSVANEIYSKYINNENLDNNFTQTFDETPIIKGDVSDVIMRKNINTLKSALKGASKKTKDVIGADLFKRATTLINELNYSAKKTKDVKQQIKDSEYYQDADTTFITVDQNGNIENPNINQAEAIQELGGIKTEEEFNEALDASELEYLKTSKAPLFQDMSQFNNIAVKAIVNGELVDKLNTEVKDTLEATIKEPENNELQTSLNNIEGYSSFVWSTSSEAVKTLLKDIEKKSLNINVDLRGLAETYDVKSQAEILTVTNSLSNLIQPDANQADMDNFIAVYQEFTNVTPELQRAVVKVDEQYRDKKLIGLDTDSSEYKTFKENGLLKIQENVYIVTDGNTKSLEEVENLMATNSQLFPAGTVQAELNNIALVKEDLNAYVESQMADVQTNGTEYDLDAVKKLIYYKTYFGTQGVKTADKSFETQLSQLPNVEINNRDYLTSDFIAEIRNKQLKGENAVLDNLIFSDKGITLRYTDEISVDEMNDYLKEDLDLRNYFLLSKNTNFEVIDVAQDDLVSQRDMMVNGATKENYKDSYRTINSETIQTKSEQDFITIDGNNYERIESDFYTKLPSNKSQFLKIGSEKPTLNIDISNYNSVQSEVKIESSNKYSVEESKKIDDDLNCK